jgi:hypothetical protein
MPPVEPPVPALPARPAPSWRPTRPTVGLAATLHGTTIWWSGVDAEMQRQRHIRKVDFLVDGKTLYTDHTWPYSFHRPIWWTRARLQTAGTCSSCAYGAGGYRTRKPGPVRVVNPPLRITITGTAAGSAVNGVLNLGARASQRIERVTLSVDGKPISATPPPCTCSGGTR